MEDNVVGQRVSPMTTCTSAASESVMSIWTDHPTYAAMRPHEGGAETQAERYSQFFATETQTEVGAG